MHTDNRFLILSLVLAAASFLLASGCISNIDSQDKLSVDLDHAPVYNFSRYVNASMCLPVNNVTPCTCMLCTADKASWGARVLSLIGLGDIEFSLNNSQCYFRACNYSMYNDTITNFIADKASAACRLSDTDTTDKICAPRYFMLGQGSNPADYAAAQRYCDGQLKMPVIWAVPNESGMLAKMPVQPATLSCYLTKDQMPVTRALRCISAISF